MNKCEYNFITRAHSRLSELQLELYTFRQMFQLRFDKREPITALMEEDTRAMDHIDSAMLHIEDATNHLTAIGRWPGKAVESEVKSG